VTSASKHIATVVGARPQFIKAAVTSHAIARSGALRETLIHTGQHYDAQMSSVFFEQLGLAAPAVNLGIGSGSHGAQTGRMLAAIEECLLTLRPDIVLVYGDTNSTLAGALAAIKLHIPIAHVEAGLRSRDYAMPEEINRVLTDQVSSLLFAPSASSVENLMKEGIPASRIHCVGDVMYDACLRFSGGPVPTDVDGLPERYVLATVHRAENTDDDARLRVIAGGLDDVAADLPVVFPMHPRTREALARIGWTFKNVHVSPPVGYLEMLSLESRAEIVVTDSGGVQKEAFFLGKPCVTLRDRTEWVELVELGWNVVIPVLTRKALADSIRSAVRGRRTAPPKVYGDGSATSAIAAILSSWAPSLPV
jgi:UDP-GlcNAc3NAcA epimerase